MSPPIAGRLVAPPAQFLGIGDERCVEAWRDEGQGEGLLVCGKGGRREEGGEWVWARAAIPLLLPVTGDSFPHSSGVLGQALGGTMTHGVALGTPLLASGSSGGTKLCLHRTTGCGRSGASRWGCGGGGRWESAGGGGSGVGFAGLGPSPSLLEVYDGSVEESKEKLDEGDDPVANGVDASKSAGASG